jgi:general L-amino acid transport system substrate-binding protein
VIRLKFEKPDDHVILSEMISREPFGVAVRQGDDQWADIVRWAQYATLAAEDLGITQQNVEEMRTQSTSPEVLRLLGKEGDMGAPLGLSPTWAYDIIRQVGNYNDIFQRSLGKDSPLAMERGYNRLWKDGGLLVSPPIR